METEQSGAFSWIWGQLNKRGRNAERVLFKRVHVGLWPILLYHYELRRAYSPGSLQQCKHYFGVSNRTVTVALQWKQALVLHGNLGMCGKPRDYQGSALDSPPNFPLLKEKSNIWSRALDQCWIFKTCSILSLSFKCVKCSTLLSFRRDAVEVIYADSRQSWKHCENFVMLSHLFADANAGAAFVNRKGNYHNSVFWTSLFWACQMPGVIQQPQKACASQFGSKRHLEKHLTRLFKRRTRKLGGTVA